VSIDVVEEDAWDFLERYAVDYPVVIDTEGDIARLFAVDGMPSGYLLDADGRVREIHIGYKSGDEIKLAKSIRNLLLEMDAS
jgi:peroxiredoxin